MQNTKFDHVTHSSLLKKNYSFAMEVNVPSAPTKRKGRLEVYANKIEVGIVDECSSNLILQ
jgi:hypothetical protein